MNCDIVKSLLVDYVEHSLSGRKRSEIEQHLSTCNHCRSELSGIKTLKQDILSMETPDHNADFWRQFDAKLSQKLAQETVPATTWRSTWLPLSALAAAAIVVVILLLRFGVSREVPERPVIASDPNPQTVWVAAVEPGDFDMGLFISEDYGDVTASEGETSVEDLELFADDFLLWPDEGWESATEETVFGDTNDYESEDTREGASSDELQDLFIDLETS